MKVAHKFAIVFLMILAAPCVRGQAPTGSILWLRADAGVVLENGHVAVWKDQSGHRNDATMSDGQQPDFLDSTSNGLPAIVFHGWNYLEAPNIFPATHDYTIAVVATITNVRNINNLVSGNTHALYLDSTLSPRVVHNSFNFQDYGTIGMDSEAASCVVALYSEVYQQAALYVNGEFADSSYVGSSPDSNLYIGSFQRGYFLQGNIQEVLLYDRELDSGELVDLDRYLRSKYGIPHAKPNPKPDSTFTSLPAPEELFARGSDDSATVPIAGTIYRAGFDSLYILEFKGGALISRASIPLHYENNQASFSFAPRIHAELSEYRFEVHITTPNVDSIIASRDSIVCGDIFLIDGQSDAIFGYDTARYSNEFCRTFGINYSQNLRDTFWSVGINDKFGNRNAVGGWGQRIQRDLIEDEHIPSCCIDGAVSATNIEAHERNDSSSYDLRTIYGQQLYRATKTGLLGAVHTMFWEQGEANYGVGYYDKFLKLHNAWKQDYPGLKKIYVVQNRPNFCYWGNRDMRDAQRTVENSLPDVETIAKAAIAGYDGCHFTDPGFDALGDRLFSAFARDFYNSFDTAYLRSPNPLWASWTHPDHHQVAILFSPPDAVLHATNDTTVDGIFATLKDYLYPDDANSHVVSVAFNNDTMFIDLDNPGNTQSIAYLPDQRYNGSDSVVYEGPWIVNQRGLGALLWYHLPIQDQPYFNVVGTSAVPSFHIAPDPTSGSITVNMAGFDGPAQVRLISETGATVWNELLPADHPEDVTFDLRMEPSGCYLLQITNGTRFAQQKFILER